MYVSNKKKNKTAISKSKQTNTLKSPVHSDNEMLKRNLSNV